MKCYKTIVIIGIRQLSLMGSRELGNKIPHLHNFHFSRVLCNSGQDFLLLVFRGIFSYSLASSQLDTKVEVTMIVMNVHIKYIFVSVRILQIVITINVDTNVLLTCSDFRHLHNQINLKARM